MGDVPHVSEGLPGWKTGIGWSGAPTAAGGSQDCPGSPHSGLGELQQCPQPDAACHPQRCALRHIHTLPRGSANKPPRNE